LQVGAGLLARKGRPKKFLALIATECQQLLKSLKHQWLTAMWELAGPPEGEAMAVSRPP